MLKRWVLGWCMYFYFYSDCKENKGIYTSLHLEYLFNINEFLNVSMVSKVWVSSWLFLKAGEVFALKHSIACLGFIGFWFYIQYILQGGKNCPTNLKKRNLFTNKIFFTSLSGLWKVFWCAFFIAADNNVFNFETSIEGSNLTSSKGCFQCLMRVLFFI